MKVKIGNAIYDSNEEPIMVVLSKEERQHIGNMAPNAKGKYLSAPDGTSEKEMRAFMVLNR